ENMRETRMALKARLKAAGKWDEFVAERERLKAEWMKPQQARAVALRNVETRPAKPACPESGAIRRAAQAPVERAEKPTPAGKVDADTLCRAQLEPKPDWQILGV